ncbi:MAG TPA: DNA alkylation repair protein [Patescibacteria group bacterium]|nr:DNA alkylation repair protein [Patescibacteria group bacterium]
MYLSIVLELKKSCHPEKVSLLQGFFKTGKGGYAEGDKFLGVVVPDQRRIAKAYRTASLKVIKRLLGSIYHEHRLTGLLILVYKYQVADEKEKKVIYNFYLKNTKSINNWDLVDVTCPPIVGDYLFSRPSERKILYRLVRSKNLWERRIAVLATFVFIRHGDFKDILKLSKWLLSDKHDLIHKAVGWMLREVGKKNQRVLTEFLKNNISKMPRTILRYAVEKYAPAERAKIMSK